MGGFEKKVTAERKKKVGGKGGFCKRQEAFCRGAEKSQGTKKLKKNQKTALLLWKKKKRDREEGKGAGAGIQGRGRCPGKTSFAKKIQRAGRGEKHDRGPKTT